MKERIFIKRAKDHVQLEEWLHNQFKDVKCGQIEIHYTPLGVRIVIHTMSPGLVIGSGGDKIREVTAMLKEKFNLDNPQIDVQKIEEPDMDPTIVAQSIASSLEHGGSSRRLGKLYCERIMRAGAIGCEIVIKGKLGGEKARSERYTEGYLKKCGDTAHRDVVQGYAFTVTKAGIIGVKVSIMIKHSDRKIEIKKPQSVEEVPQKDNGLEVEKIKDDALPEATTPASSSSYQQNIEGSQ